MAQAGNLRHRVEIQQPIQDEDPAGGLTAGDRWTTIATVWASVEESGGSEDLAEDVRVSRTEATIRMRERDDVDPTKRILHDGEAYEIETVSQDPTKQRMLEIQATKLEGRT